MIKSDDTISLDVSTVDRGELFHQTRRSKSTELKFPDLADMLRKRELNSPSNVTFI